jgi:hypothetical protein
MTTQAQPMADGLRALATLAAVALALFAMGWPEFGDSRTVYERSCVKHNADGSRCVTWAAGPRTTYTVARETQTVVANDGSAIARLSHCAVQDADNWTCTDDGVLAVTRSMRDGKYSATMDGVPGLLSAQIRRYEWLVLEYLGSPP